MTPQEIKTTTSIRTLKQIRKQLKKSGDDPVALKLIDNRIKKLQFEHKKKVNIETEKKSRIMTFFNKMKKVIKR